MSWSGAQNEYDNHKRKKQEEQMKKEKEEEEERKLFEIRRKEEKKEMKELMIQRIKHRNQEINEKKPGKKLFDDICKTIENDEDFRLKIKNNITNGNYDLIRSMDGFVGGFSGIVFNFVPEQTLTSINGKDIKCSVADYAQSIEQEIKKGNIKPYDIKHDDCQGWQVVCEGTNKWWKILRHRLII